MLKLLCHLPIAKSPTAAAELPLRGCQQTRGVKELGPSNKNQPGLHALFTWNGQRDFFPLSLFLAWYQCLLKGCWFCL